MQNKPLAQRSIAGAAIKYIVHKEPWLALCDVLRAPKVNIKLKIKAMALACAAVAVTGCASGPSATPALPFYRCEYGLEFTAKFSGDSVVLDSSRGYDVLYRGVKNANPDVAANAKSHPNEYSNTRMSAEFKLGVLERDAIVRYPLLPLVSRCVRDN
jgi:hypothetical protein